MKNSRYIGFKKRATLKKNICIQYLIRWLHKGLFILTVFTK